MDRSGRGLNIVGHLEAEVGVGEIARQLVQACDAAGVPVLPVSLPAGASRQGHRFPHATPPITAFDTTLACLNPDQLPRLAANLGRCARTVGMWWWEASVLPPWLAESATHVDELWAGSTWLAQVLRAAVDVPVHVLPIPVSSEAQHPRTRVDLGLPPGLLFLTVFDHNSVLERKNPVGVVEAYRRAFPDPSAATALVVKSINGDSHPEAAARLARAAEGRDDIHLVDRYLSAADKEAWMGSCDCYVSLHRSEGYGLTIAEAMALARPVIATAWSGEADFTTPETAFVVPHRLTPVGPGNDPYPAAATWADPDLDAAAELMRRVADDAAAAAAVGAAGRAYVAKHLSHASVGRRIRELLHDDGDHEETRPAASALVTELARLRASGTLRAIQRSRPLVATIAPVSDPHDIVDVGRTLARTQAELSDCDAELALAEERLLDAEQRAALVEAVALERDEARVETRELEQRYRELERQTEVLEADKAELRELLARSRRVFEEMQESASWRLTRPLRAAKKQLESRRR